MNITDLLKSPEALGHYKKWLQEGKRYLDLVMLEIRPRRQPFSEIRGDVTPVLYGEASGATAFYERIQSLDVPSIPPDLSPDEQSAYGWKQNMIDAGYTEEQIDKELKKRSGGSP